MYSLVTINSLLYTSSIVVESLVAAVLLCNNTINIAEDSLPDINMLLSILASAVNDF